MEELENRAILISKPYSFRIEAIALLKTTLVREMKAIKVMGTVDERGQLALDYPLTIDKQSRVEVIVLIDEEETELSENVQSKEEILGDLRQAWQEVKNGEALPIDQLWSD